MFQLGSQHLNSGDQLITVGFATSFVTTLPKVYPVLRNSASDSSASGDNPIQPITVLLTSVALGGFTVALDAPVPTAHYYLDYYAGDPSAIFQALTLTGVKVSGMDTIADLPDDTDSFYMVDRSGPVPLSKQLVFRNLRQAFTSKAQGTPSSPSASDSDPDLKISDQDLYVKRVVGGIPSYVKFRGQAVGGTWSIAQPRITFTGTQDVGLATDLVTITLPTGLPAAPVMAAPVLIYNGTGDAEFIQVRLKSLDSATAVFKLSSIPADQTAGAYTLHYIGAV